MIKGVRAIDGDWSELASEDITAEEFPEGVLEWLDFEVIKVLALARKLSVAPMIPSPVAEAHVRHEGNSQHSTKNKTRLSKGVDFFCRWKDAASIMEILRAIPEVGGLGIYTNMTFRGVVGGHAMIHMDLRKRRLEWVGWKVEPSNDLRYAYLAREPKRYHSILHEQAGW